MSRGFGRMQRSLGRRRRRVWPLSVTPTIENERFLTIGGLHRRDTSILHRLLHEHTQTSGFADTGVPEDEGQHLQTVFPSARAHGDPGRFAFDRRSNLLLASTSPILIRSSPSTRTLP